MMDMDMDRLKTQADQVHKLADYLWSKAPDVNNWDLAMQTATAIYTASINRSIAEDFADLLEAQSCE